MRAFTTAALAVAASLAGAQALAAQPSHLTDVQFIEANRCVGLMSSKSLGTPDVSAMKQLVKTESSGRVGWVYDKAEQARDEAQQQANHAGSADARLVGERDGVCHAMIDSSVASGGVRATAQMIR